ncbi:MAG: hypothetical protein BWY80_00167 [Firmicutes bacterium ADurb.Bin456]|nr:MAG: hypothetical protein BWY80_00167 [Firmicutes bacterium ADurb.Bin456]
MKRKLTYLIAFLVILGAVVVPAIYMNKVFSAGQPGPQAVSAGSGINGGEQGGAADRNQTSPELKETSPGTDPASSGANQTSSQAAAGAADDPAQNGDPANPPQAAASGAVSGENNAPAPAANPAVAAPPAREGAGPAAPAAASGEGCPVWIAVVGKNGEQLYQAGQILLTKENNKWGVNALGALEVTGLPYVTSPTWRNFVYSISGQANSGVSGWMYAVNGDAPNHMADKHPVKAGDRVIWWYSHSMEQPQPRWDDLIQKK